jgi:hypothetical protein
MQSNRYLVEDLADSGLLEARPTADTGGLLAAKLRRRKMRKDTNTTWRKELDEAFREAGDSWETVEASTLTEANLNTPFDPGYGCTEGCPFTVWTRQNVYFPWCYDGAEGVQRVSRNPDGVATPHVGGG